MRKTLTVIAAMTLLSLTACGNGEDAAMPDVQSQRLDIALSDIGRAGYDSDDVEIVGGGVFGVVDESNWSVCAQEPAAGDTIGDAPRLTVERTCDDELDPEDIAVEETENEATAAAEEAAPVAEEVASPADGTKQDKKNKKKPVPVNDTFTMPALVGMNLQDAQDTLQALGSFLLTQTDATGMGRFQVLDSGWKVCYQKPSAGTPTSIATMVDLGAVKLHENC